MNVSITWISDITVMSPNLLKEDKTSLLNVMDPRNRTNNDLKNCDSQPSTTQTTKMTTMYWQTDSRILTVARTTSNNSYCTKNLSNDNFQS